jgi:hypothetical protein
MGAIGVRTANHLRPEPAKAEDGGGVHPDNPLMLAAWGRVRT